MTTLFSIFAPLFLLLSLKLSVLMLLLLSCMLLLLLFCMIDYLMWSTKYSTMASLFSSMEKSSIVFVSLFMCLSILNLSSLMIYSYPVTTTLGFNFSAAFSCWLCSMVLQMMKSEFFSSILPQNSPWYLIPFLCLVELVSISVRPITLCFRLLANMVAGHVLITLICKMELVWIAGSLFGTLELAVAMVQAFVFSMLVSVYLEEAMSH